LITQK